MFKVKNQARNKLAQNVRWQALLLLDQIFNEGQYSNVVIDEFLQKNLLNKKDQDLLVKLVYGVIQNRTYLDYQLAEFIQDKKIDDWVHILLQLSTYQLIFLDRVPSHAVVDQAVQIAKLNSHQGLANLVNAILRNFDRRGIKALDDKSPINEQLATKYSMPLWLVAYFQEKFPQLDQEALLANFNQEAKLSVRVNQASADPISVKESLESEGYQVESSQLSPLGLLVKGSNPIHSAAYLDGQFIVQDESSMTVAPLAQLQGREQVLDACAAPGGKATHIAQILKEKNQAGHLTALDLSAYKLNRLAEHAQRMGLDSYIDLKVEDFLAFGDLSQAGFDVIYLDAPCSGLGLMRRKPEIKYEKTYEDILALSQIQSEMLEHAADLLKSGGRLIYSTCTLSLEENEANIREFIQKHPEFSIDPVKANEVMDPSVITPEGMVRLWPHIHQCDGFFICRMIKN